MMNQAARIVAGIGILLGVSILALEQDAAMAQESAAKISGKVLVDGSPLTQRIGIRIERLDSSLVDTVYTSGSMEFSVLIAPFDPNEHYYLVVRDQRYKELKYELEYSLFRMIGANPILGRPNNAAANLYQYSETVLLQVESIEPVDAKPASKIVRVRKIPADVSDQAVKEYDQAIEDLNRGEKIAAMTHLEKAVALAPKYFDAVNKLGSEYLKSGQYGKAETMLEHARTLDAQDESSRINLGILHMLQGEQEAAAAGAEEELDLDGQESIPGGASFRKAADVLEEAVKIAPQSAKSNFYLGAALYRLKELDRSEKFLLDAVAIDARLAEAHLTLINIYKLQKRYDAALLQVDAYLEAVPDSPQREQLEKFKTQIVNASNKN